jgi:hypothetical protein
MTESRESIAAAMSHKVDRTGWPSGPWDAEPDRVEWPTAVGYTGLIVRNDLGNLCGYVAVVPGHPAYERTWMSADCYELGDDGKLDYQRQKANPVSDLSVHGGITYADHCAGRICHLPAPGEPDNVWWLGFDCAHSGDLVPNMHRHFPHDWGHYRDVAYVRTEVESLAAQLKSLEPA